VSVIGNPEPNGMCKPTVERPDVLMLSATSAGLIRVTCDPLTLANP
jgi:hypothetical protein